MLGHDEIRSFRQRGFVYLPKLVAHDEIDALRAVVEELAASIDNLPQAVRQDFHYGGLFSDAIGQGSRLCRLEYTFDKHVQFLELLGNPRVLEVVASLHQGPVVVTWEDMVIKTPGSGHDVPWHQDALFQSVTGTVFSVGIYLDDSPDDPLTVIPGTHRLGPLSEGAIAAVARERGADAVALPARAGDAIVHNVRVIHGSRANDGARVRRVVYFEFRTVAQVRNDSPWDDAWLARRLPYIPLAVQVRAASPWAATDDTTRLEELKDRHPDWFTLAVHPDAVDLRVHHHEVAQRR